MSAVLVGYIHSPRSDLLWFVALPFIATAIALFFHTSLPYMAEASIAVWITVPHHYAGWMRGYGLGEDWVRWRARLAIAPLILIPSVLYGTAFIPITMAIVLMLWDHQHSLMQQYGFSRIYDFKAGAGAPNTARLDFWLSVVLYSNMLLTAPLWAELWIAELYRWNLGMSVAGISQLQSGSLLVTAAYLLFYVVQLQSGVSRGFSINPMKYLFLASSYGLWYFVSWQDSFLVYLVAHRIMHGLQYMVMVYWYLDNKAERAQQVPRFFGRLNAARFIGFGLMYGVLFHLATGGDVSLFGFGLIESLQEDEFLQYSAEKATGFYAATAVSAAAACHYYLDSYIWKVRDPKTQEGL
ncbi:MAG: hypothetical protein ACI8W3_002067 [Myxococcota bacterium]